VKQFHNRMIAGSRLSWDVDRLVLLAADLPVKAVPLASIFEFDTVYWFDAQFPATCRAVVDHLRRIEAVDLAYPIILSDDGHVMDGMHRVAKALLQDKSDILAVQFEKDPEPDHRS